MHRNSPGKYHVAVCYKFAECSSISLNFSVRDGRTNTKGKYETKTGVYFTLGLKHLIAEELIMKLLRL